MWKEKGNIVTHHLIKGLGARICCQFVFSQKQSTWFNPFHICLVSLPGICFSAEKWTEWTMSFTFPILGMYGLWFGRMLSYPGRKEIGSNNGTNKMDFDQNYNVGNWMLNSTSTNKCPANFLQECAITQVIERQHNRHRFCLCHQSPNPWNSKNSICIVFFSLSFCKKSAASFFSENSKETKNRIRPCLLNFGDAMKKKFGEITFQRTHPISVFSVPLSN